MQNPVTNVTFPQPIFPTIGNEYRSPWRALIMRRSHRRTFKIKIRAPMTGIHPKMSEIGK
jgi:hypothetical protein